MWQVRSAAVEVIMRSSLQYSNLEFKHKKEIPLPESASELHRSSDYLLSAKFLSNFVDRGVSRSQHGGSPTAVISFFLSFKKLPSCTHEAEWTPFQTHYFSENLLAPEIEPGPLDL
jgi:hypothetical protein